MIQVILAKPRAEVSKNKRNETCRKWLCNIHFHLLSCDFSIEISYFSLLFDWNLYFLFTFLLKLYFTSLCVSIDIFTFSLVFYWNLYFLFTFLLKPLLSLYISIQISASSLHVNRNLYFLYLSLYFSIETFTKNLHSLRFSNEISAFPLHFYYIKSLLSLYFSMGTSTLFPRASERRVFQKEGGVNRSTYKRSSHMWYLLTSSHIWHLLTSSHIWHLLTSDIFWHLLTSDIFSHLLTSDIFSHLTSSHLSSLFFLLKAGGRPGGPSRTSTLCGDRACRMRET